MFFVTLWRKKKKFLIRNISFYWIYTLYMISSPREMCDFRHTLINVHTKMNKLLPINEGLNKNNINSFWEFLFISSHKSWNRGDVWQLKMLTSLVRWLWDRFGNKKGFWGPALSLDCLYRISIVNVKSKSFLLLEPLNKDQNRPKK